MPAVGFAVNVNAIAAANLRSNRSTKARHAEVLVFAADEDLIDGISHCTKSLFQMVSVQSSAPAPRLMRLWNMLRLTR